MGMIVDSGVFSKNPSCPWPGTYPQPRPGWGAAMYCTSCERNTPWLADLGKGFGELADCMDACEKNQDCKWIGFAESGDHHCILYSSCEDVWERPDACTSVRDDWWTTYRFSRDSAAAVFELFFFSMLRWQFHS